MHDQPTADTADTGTNGPDRSRPHYSTKPPKPRPVAPAMSYHNAAHPSRLGRAARRRKARFEKAIQVAPTRRRCEGRTKGSALIERQARIEDAFERQMAEDPEGTTRNSAELAVQLQSIRDRALYLRKANVRAPAPSEAQ